MESYEMCIPHGWEIDEYGCPVCVGIALENARTVELLDKRLADDFLGVFNEADGNVVNISKQDLLELIKGEAE